MTEATITRDRLEAAARKLKDACLPHAIATVVRTISSTSAKPGSRALLSAEGQILEGWVGGGCARAAIAKAARTAIETGQPQFVSLRPGELLDEAGVMPGEEREGVRYARNGCPSKGSLDIFVEPVLPQARLVVMGDSPVALALADLAGRLDFHRTLCAPGADPARLPDVEAHAEGYEVDLPGAAEGFVVVATQGKGDEAALTAALATGAGYVAFVGSRRKFAALADKLRAKGVPEERLSTVRAPAGLAIGAIALEEIALSILAEVVQERRKPRQAPAQTN